MIILPGDKLYFFLKTALKYLASLNPTISATSFILYWPPIIKSTAFCYHINCRCVQKAWLLGTDPDTGHDYNHHKDWIPDKLKYY
jgi:hypothetical protein